MILILNKYSPKLVESYGNNNDILICLSTSGKSKNIIKAIEVAVKKKLLS